MKYKNFEIRIEQDPSPEDPRAWGGHCTMVCDHNRYLLGDQNLSSDDVKELMEESYWLPLYLYDHSGITMRTSRFACQWDSGRVGTIFIEKKKALEEAPEGEDPKAWAIKVMKGDVEVYDQYLRGNVFGYTICDGRGRDTGESCWGFYGYDHEGSDLLPQARQSIDYLVASRDKYILNHLPELIEAVGTGSDLTIHLRGRYPKTTVCQAHELMYGILGPLNFLEAYYDEHGLEEGGKKNILNEIKNP